MMWLHSWKAEISVAMSTNILSIATYINSWMKGCLGHKVTSIHTWFIDKEFVK